MKRLAFLAFLSLLVLIFIFFYKSLFLSDKKQTTIPAIKLKFVNFQQLQNWEEDNQADAFKAFKKSCARIVNKNPAQKFASHIWAGKYEDWQEICQEALMLTDINRQEAKIFFEKWFLPYAVYDADTGSNIGLFTGYYEPLLYGSLDKTEKYNIPLYKKPIDLVEVNLGKFRKEFQGERIAGRIKDGWLVPYYSREEIEVGALRDNEVLLWVDSQIQSFFLHIQGSGIVKMTDGSYVRVGYAGQNGHIYYAIGKYLIEIGAVKKEDMSMQAIRDWLVENPEKAQALMNKNKSYVFFRRLDGKEAPLGGEGVELTANRSLAIDRRIIPYGAPIWLDADGVFDKNKKIQRLMVAQDTGGAIRGAVRGDVFWGNGEKAEKLAGTMKSKGKYYILLPKRITVIK